MKSLLTILLYLAAGFLVLILISGISMYTYYGIKSYRTMSKAGDEAPVLKTDGYSFRDTDTVPEFRFTSSSHLPVIDPTILLTEQHPSEMVALHRD